MKGAQCQSCPGPGATEGEASCDHVAVSPRAGEPASVVHEEIVDVAEGEKWPSVSDARCCSAAADSARLKNSAVKKGTFR